MKHVKLRSVKCSRTNFIGLIIICMTMLTACNNSKNLYSSSHTREIYREALKEAMTPDSTKIDSSLISINSLNSRLFHKRIDGEDYILMVSWISKPAYYRSSIDSLFYNTGNHAIWVTAAPELKERLADAKIDSTGLRINQLLGMPPDSGCKWFVEFWVRPADLYRPCPDAEVNDRKCDLFFPADADSAHIRWINNYRINSYYQKKLYQNYPWTQLGYTYDWCPSNRSHIGLSEFVIRKHCKIVVHGIYSGFDYLQRK